MRKRDLEKLKKMLLEERAKVLDHVQQLSEDSSNEITQIGGDAADIASVQISQSARQRLGKREQRLLSKIDKALKKMDEGEYGICEYSGEQIPIPRLMARPMAQYTVEAKAELERQKRRYRDNESMREDDESSLDEYD